MRRILSFVARGNIPGVGDGGGELVQNRAAAGVLRHRRRIAVRAGARTGAQKQEDANLRAVGVPVFDRRAGQSELSGYIGRARGRG